MKDASGQPSALDLLADYAQFSAEEVREYLLAHPEFFVEHADLLEQINIPHQLRGSVSLVELQSDQLRQKVKKLSKKLSQLIAIAKQNERIYRIYADLNLRLLRCKDMVDLQLTLEDVMVDELHLSAVTLKPFKGAYALPEIQRKLFIEKRFKQDTFFFGRLSQHEKQLLFGEQIAESVALVLLGHPNDLGILAVGSRDSSHFNPEMDTLLITQLQQFLTILLPKLTGY